MERCSRCGRRWCACIPAGASVDWFTAAPPGPMLGPDRRGVDANMEILEVVADVLALPVDEWSTHLRDLGAAYSPAQLTEALLVAVERVGVLR
jgi:hypothetical protein